MEKQLISNLILFVGFATGLTYGVHKYLTVRKALYFQMITAAIGCAAVARLYNVVALLCMGKYASGFNVGLIGPISCFCLLFCAEYGALDRLVDRTDKKNKRASFLALIVPALLAVISCQIILADDVDIVYRALIMFTLAIICAASYFNFKHLILSKEKNEMFVPLRAYNTLALETEALYVFELVFLTYGRTVLTLSVQGIMLIISIIILPVLNKGVVKWTI